MDNSSETAKNEVPQFFTVESGYRFYSPELGRWLSRDPIEEEGGENLTAYVLNQALSLIDAIGQTADSPGYEIWKPFGAGKERTISIIYKSVSAKGFKEASESLDIADIAASYTEVKVPSQHKKPPAGRAEINYVTHWEMGGLVCSLTVEIRLVVNPDLRDLREPSTIGNTLLYRKHMGHGEAGGRLWPVQGSEPDLQAIIEHERGHLEANVSELAKLRELLTTNVLNKPISRLFGGNVKGTTQNTIQSFLTGMADKTKRMADDRTVAHLTSKGYVYFGTSEPASKMPELGDEWYDIRLVKVR